MPVLSGLGRPIQTHAALVAAFGVDEGLLSPSFLRELIHWLLAFQAASGQVLGVGLVLVSAFFVGFFCGIQRPVYFVAGAV